jgi:hypothetical protein
VDGYPPGGISSQFVLLEKDSLTLTKKGLEFIINEIASIDSDYCIKISPVVSRLFKEGLYDTAVREACVTLEQAIKNEIKSKMWGKRLTDNLLKSLRDEDRVLESSIRTYSQELRMVFKLVRNVFMHNIKKIDQDEARILLFQVFRVITAINESS